MRIERNVGTLQRFSAELELHFVRARSPSLGNEAFGTRSPVRRGRMHTVRIPAYVRASWYWNGVAEQGVNRGDTVGELRYRRIKAKKL